MAQNSYNNAQSKSMPQLKALQLPYSQFSERFSLIEVIEEPYLRAYDICRDSAQADQRVAIKRYCADSEDKKRDVLQNMDSYRQLGEIEGVCALVAFTYCPEEGQVHAAFEYNDTSLHEIRKNYEFSQQRSAFYIFLIRQLLRAIETIDKLGIQVEEIVPQNILLQKVGEEFKVKLLYDEREKKYDQILQGIKVYSSPQKVRYYLQNEEEWETSNGQEVVFELGLFFLDLINDYEQRDGQPFSRDAPLVRSNQHESYLVIRDSTPIVLNNQLISKQLQFLNQSKSRVVGLFKQLIQKMITDVPERISLPQLIAAVGHIELTKLEEQDKKEGQRPMTPHKDSPDVQQVDNPPSQNKQSKGKAQETTHVKTEQTQTKGTLTSSYKQTMVSQTTVSTANHTSTEQKYKSHDTLPQVEKEYPQLAKTQVIPKQALLRQARWHSKMVQDLQRFIEKLSSKGFVTKQYYDKSLYYGEIESGSQKRQGHGIYVYCQGDIYYGLWQQNSLLQGTYLFRNGESFKGAVKNGKQGFGIYYYANGNIYQGEWRNDIKFGQGTMNYPNGDVYTGMWSNGKKNGQGIYNYSNGTVYRGGFVNGKKSGFGVITFPNGTKIEAQWNQTHIQGVGKVFYANGNYFEGNYHRSEKHGPGMYIWDDTKYEGGFEKDTMEGSALIKFSEDQFYQGTIKNGKRWGPGLYRYSNGDKFEGEWKNDQKVYGRYLFNEGGSFEGRFKANQISYGLMIYENGQSYEGQFSQGERRGLGTYRSSDGKVLMEGKWQRDQYVAPF